MADVKDLVAGSSSLVLGADSYTIPSELGETEYVMGMNVACRGGIVQTRPGTRTMLCLPDGNFQGVKLFTPQNGISNLVAAVDGAIYVSPAPFTSFRRLRNVQFSKTAKFLTWTICLKSTDYTPSGVFFPLDNPYSVLIMQDGLTRAAFWDGGNSGHLKPASDPDVTDMVVPGFNETPIGLWSIWSGNRLWVSRGNEIFASDIGNPTKFTEALYLNEGRAFYLSGPCTGMIETPDRQGIIAFTANDGTFFHSANQDRPSWLDESQFQNVIVPNTGCVAPRSLINQYGLTWWFGPRGLTCIDSALRSNITSRIDYRDNEMFSSKAYVGPELDGICASYYENYLLVSVPSGDVLNRHTWALDQAPFEQNAAAWTGFWTGWRPIEWARGIVNGSERIFFGSIDYDGKNRIWEAMLAEKTDNGCPITCFLQTREHTYGDLNQKRYNWSKFFLSQIYGAVDLNVYVASTKGGFQLQHEFHLEANSGQIFSDSKYSEAGPLMVGNRSQVRVIRTPSNPENDDCNVCGVESTEGNMIDYAFSNLLVWSGQMGVRAYQAWSRESPFREGGECELPETGPRTLNDSGCSGLSLVVDGQVFEKCSATAEGVARTSYGTTIYIRRVSTSAVSQENAQALAECAVEQIINRLDGQNIAPGVYETDKAVLGSDQTFVIVDSPIAPPSPPASPDLKVISQLYSLNFQMVNGVGATYGPIFPDCFDSGGEPAELEIPFTLTNPPDAAGPCVFSTTEISGDEEFSLSIVPEDDLDDGTLGVGETSSGSLLVLFDQDSFEENDFTATITLHYTVNGVSKTWTYAITLSTKACDLLNPVKDSLLSLETPFASNALATAAMATYGSNCLGWLDLPVNNPARLISFLIEQLDAQTIHISGEIAWQSGDSQANPNGDVWIKLDGLEDGFTIDYAIDSAAGGTGNTSVSFSGFSCCGWGPAPGISTSPASRSVAADSISGTLDGTVTDPQIYGLVLGFGGRNGAANVQFDLTITNPSDDLTPINIGAFANNGNGGRQIVSCT